eukprot:15468338-Alexandrium_andersonii.AAC.1
MQPTTLRRLVEAAAAATIAPVVEPTFSARRAGRATGRVMPRERVIGPGTPGRRARTEPPTAFMDQDERCALRQALLGPAAEA